MMLRHEDLVIKWLSAHGKHLTRLQISHSQSVQPALLPCPNLRQLTLDRPSCWEQLDTHDGHPDLLQGLTKLTYLALWCGTPPHAREVSSLVHLRHLDMYPRECKSELWRATISGATLSCLTQLTYLRAKLTAGNLGQLGMLSTLQELHL